MVWVSIVIVAIMTAFAIIGIVDKLFCKDKLGLGPEFTKGLEMIGGLCLAIIGIIALVPVISWVMENTIAPLYRNMGLNPSMAVTSILAIDMGGYQLATSIAGTSEAEKLIGEWAGVVYGSMMGATIVFSIPVGLASITKKDVSAFSKGILYGIAAIPFGTFVGGVMMGIDVVTVLLNLIPPVIFSAIIITCLAIWPNGTARVFKWFSILVNAVALLGLALAMTKDLVLIPVYDALELNIGDVAFINLIGSCYDGIGVAGAVGLVLAGALPFIACLNKWLKKPLGKLSRKINFSEEGLTGFLLSCANNMAMFSTMGKMREKEKILNTAFAVCAAFVIGDHLAFAAGNCSKESIVPMMVAKLVSGIIAVLIAVFFTRKMKNEAVVEEEPSATPELEGEAQ